MRQKLSDRVSNTIHSPIYRRINLKHYNCMYLYAPDVVGCMSFSIIVLILAHLDCLGMQIITEIIYISLSSYIVLGDFQGYIDRNRCLFPQKHLNQIRADVEYLLAFHFVTLSVFSWHDDDKLSFITCLCQEAETTLAIS
jgi:hypothetical protein